MSEQQIIPYLYYADGAAALDFLRKAFGFEERMRMARADGSIMHAEAGYGGSVIMLGTPVDEPGQVGRKDLPRHSSVMCKVDDVDAHYARAKDAGAEIKTPLQDQSYGERSYTAVDLEGHVWHFSSPLGDA